MTDSDTLAALEALFSETAKAHDEAFTDRGDDPEWALWFAHHLADPMSKLLGTKMTKAELVACLLDAEDEHTACASDVPWAEHYARHFAECYARSPTAKQDALALYHYDTCPYCVRVRRVIDELGLDVELRDIWGDPEHRRALAAARGRTTVPVLHIATPDGDERWMPESRDIVRYLRQMYGPAEK
jgi:glutaredoxin